jgi:PIN domain nuclease of toxin-antitoxin system
MRILLDTHVFLWFIAGDARLPPHLSRGITNNLRAAKLSRDRCFDLLARL